MDPVVAADHPEHQVEALLAALAVAADPGVVRRRGPCPEVQVGRPERVEQREHRRRVVAVVQAQPDVALEPADVIAFVKQRLGSVKAPKDVWVWEDLPRSKAGKVLKSEIKTTLTR